MNKKILKLGFPNIMKNKFLVFLFVLFIIPTISVQAQELDTDNDGLSDHEEINIFFTNPNNPDSDGDNWSDGIEAHSGYDPNVNEDRKLEKKIEVNLKTQSLSFFSGRYELGRFLISSGDTKHPTPPGEYSVLVKKPVVNYKGVGYNYPNTKWNLMFKKGKSGNYYIHGAYWHNNFGKKVSHGCLNVAYLNMENLYNWADVGSKISIKSE